MRYLYNKISVLALLTCIIFSACQTEKKLPIEGIITNAAGETLFLEHRSLTGVIFVDSIVMRDTGTFRFKTTIPQSPEFYQLRLGNQMVVFAVYGNEKITITADANNLFHSFSVADSPTNDELRHIDRLRLQVSEAFADLERQHATQQISDEEFMISVDNILGIYKDQAIDIIRENPSGAAAYYALFQRIGNYLIFDPHNRQDFPWFGAVATSWNLNYPEASRTRHLYDFTLLALHSRREAERQARILEEIVELEANLPDIVLPDTRGNSIALSSFQGRVVLLDFTVYDSEFSATHNAELYSIYNRFRARGVVIYQIAFDPDAHFWRNVAAHLPWTTVRDPLALQSTLLLMYNITEVPTMFLVDREGDVVFRAESYEQLVQELNRLL